ncbi:hypothetical protein D3C87_1329090 [compost metagenome]
MSRLVGKTRQHPFESKAGKRGRSDFDPSGVGEFPIWVRYSYPEVEPLVIFCIFDFAKAGQATQI